MIAVLSWSGGMCGATQVIGIFPNLSLAKEWVETNYSWKNLFWDIQSLTSEKLNLIIMKRNLLILNTIIT